MTKLKERFKERFCFEAEEGNLCLNEAIIPEKLLSFIESELALERKKLAEKIKLESLKDEHKKDVQTCPGYVLQERIAYNEGLKKGFTVSATLVEEKR
jgi:hypothetical protein